MKKIFALCLVSLTLSACVMNEELDSVIQEQETPTVRVSNVQNQEARSIPESEFARLVVDFKNQTTDLRIKVKSIQMCNIHQSGTYLYPTTSNEGYWLPDSTLSSLNISSTPIELTPTDSIRLTANDGIPFIPQWLKAWSPTVLPQTTKDCYILMQCQILQGNTLIVGNTDEEYTSIAIPFSKHLKKGKVHTLEIVLEHGCFWYDISGSSPSPILNPITFGVSVEEWVDAGSNTIDCE